MKRKILRRTGAGFWVIIFIFFLGWQLAQPQNDSQKVGSPKESTDTRQNSIKQESIKKKDMKETLLEEKKNSQQMHQDRKDESAEGFSPIQPEPLLDFASIQLMEAGTILDISKIEAGLSDRLFYSEEIGAELQQKISGISYQENEHISLSDLRYLRVLHMGFDGQTHIGELIVNVSIAEDILEIMSELYKNSYPIEKMVLIDEYGAEDESSMSDNNTSAFNYRKIAGTSRISRHGYGTAIDINPRFNPYIKEMDNGETKISPVNGAEYADRSQEFDHKIDESDLCYQLFTEHGFIWGGSWNSVKDYQHFEK